MSDLLSVGENLARIHDRISAACQRSGREASEVQLLAVSKGRPPARVKEAVEAGLKLIGENRVQEARAKIPLCPANIQWHLIGHLQSNKCRDAVHWFQMIQSVDSLNLAQEIQKAAEKLAKRLPVLLEVNVAGEASKFGWKPDQLLDDLLRVNELPRLEIHGLMTIAPFAIEPEKVRPVFRELRTLREKCEQRLGGPLPVLSMGMSNDFEIAIEEGASLIRIGSALFGARS